MTDPVAAAFRAHQRLLWALCYRMTGSASDADDLVQETFARALGSPPPDLAGSLRPWLVRVAMNLARDQLRRRRRTRYDGPWLPAPIDTDEEAGEWADLPIAHEPAHTEARYDLLESVTLAFLIALEALSPPRRAVLLLRDVFDYSVAETAEALGLSVANVKTTHHRARRAMAGYDASRAAPTAELGARTRAALERFLVAVAMQDVAAVERMLADDVRALSDGGEYLAARVPLIGPARVARAYVRLGAKLAEEGGEGDVRREVRSVNGVPALVVEYDRPPRRWAPRWMIQVELGPDGLIRAIHSVLAAPKVAALRAVSPSTATSQPG
jgi:RNA polymerase sigma-70 factor (ECF subfamily)